MTTLLNNRYQIIQVLGHGGFGETFLAEDTYLPSRRHCVIKQLKPVTNNPQMYQLIQERFQREAATLESLGEGSDQIPKLYAYFSENGQFHLVQEYIQGQTLSQKVEAQGPLSESAVREILVSLLPVLDYVHSKGIIHRDIKPDNIILRQANGKPVLIDFGAVKETMTTPVNFQGNQNESIVVGTPGFMSPEQAVGRPVYASDFYSLGLTAIYLLTSKQPGELQTDPRTGQILWRQHALNVSPNLANVLDKAIQPHPSDRYSTARQMLNALPSGASVPPPQPATQATVVVSPGSNTPHQKQPVPSPQQPVPPPHTAPVINPPSNVINWQKALFLGALPLVGLLAAVAVVGLIRKQPEPPVATSPPPQSSSEPVATTQPKSREPASEPTDASPPPVTSPVPSRRPESAPDRYNATPIPAASVPATSAPDRYNANPTTPAASAPATSAPDRYNATPIPAASVPATSTQGQDNEAGNDSAGTATTQNVPAFPTGTPISDVESALGQPIKNSKGAWSNTRAVIYDDFVPNQIDLGYLYDRDSRLIRQTEVGFAQSVDPQVMLTSLDGMLGGRATKDIKQGLTQVQQRRYNYYSFTQGTLKGMIVRQDCDDIYISVWEADLHDFVKPSVVRRC